MKVKLNYLAAIGALFIAMFVFITACEEEKTVPALVPIKAEIKQIIVNNSVFVLEYRDLVVEDLDTVIIVVPLGTDITNLDVDILYSYFGSITPEPGITDFTNPVTYTITSNAETRDVMVMVQQVPPSLTSFQITSPVQLGGNIVRDPMGLGNDTIKLSILKGIDVTNVSFNVEFFGESVIPDPLGKIDLTKDTIIIVKNKEFESSYVIDIEYYRVIEFTGTIFDGTQTPTVFLPGSVDPADEDGWAVEEDADAYQGSVVHFTSLEDDNNQAEILYGGMGLNADPNETTTILRVKGIAVAEEEYLEIAFKVDGLRAKFLLRKDRIQLGGAEEKYPLAAYPDFDPLAWNIYRITLNKVTLEIKLYMNEEAEPFLESSLEPHDGGPYVKVGDGGGKLYESLIDYIIFEAEGAYSPEDLSLEKIMATIAGSK